MAAIIRLTLIIISIQNLVDYVWIEKVKHTIQFDNISVNANCEVDLIEKRCKFDIES